VSPPAANSEDRTFSVRGIVQEIKSDGKTAVIKHETIPGYMDAMTMPFDVKNRARTRKRAAW
jgi:Cu/Ag efflux protein CusF